MKKTKKILFILLMIISIFFMIDKKYVIGTEIDIFEAGRDFITAGKDELSIFPTDIFNPTEMADDILNPDRAVEKGSKILGRWLAKGEMLKIVDTLWAVGLLVIFISTVVLGIKYMFVLPQEKSRLKQATTPYIIGVVIIFGATSIWKFLIWILDGSI